MNISRAWAMPSGDTFSIKPIREFIEPYVSGVVVDPFVRNSPFKNVCVSNDIDPEIDADFHMDALHFLKTIESKSVDLLILDPPYSPRQVSECYRKLGMTVNMETTQSSFWGDLKKEAKRVVKVGGKAVMCGWNSGGIGESNGFIHKSILLVAHGGSHNDTIVTIEERIITESDSQIDMFKEIV